MNEFQRKILKHLNIEEKDLEFYQKKADYNDIEDPYHFLNMDIAVARIKSAIDKKENIMIYGDYDCDGISATSIMVKMFQYLGVKVGYYIPSRYIDGYGINMPRAKQIIEKGYQLVITVDNGVAASEAINYLTDNKVDVILTDHHAITRELPKALCVIHPDLKNVNDDLKQCGAYVAFMLSIALLNKIDDYLLTLAAIATISDMMPLKSYNRNVVKLGLDIINSHREYPYWLLTGNESSIDAETLGFIICPKINAYGRIKEDLSVNDMVRFFVTDNRKILLDIAKGIENTNNERKVILAHAFSKIDLSKYFDKKVIVERFDDISEGVIGLIAARILNESQKPCFVFTKVHNEEILKGSARSLDGFNLEDAFTELSNYLLAYGGHAQAGGLSLSTDNYSLFSQAVDHYAKDKIIKLPQEETIKAEYFDLTYENYLFLKSLSPFGTDFNCPKFRIVLNKNHVFSIGQNKNHIKGRINQQCTFIGFNLANSLGENNDIIAVGTFGYDEFAKGKNISFKIDKIISE